MNRAYNHVFFDLDHTIWDFEKNSWETLKEVWEKFDLYRLAKIPLDNFRNLYKKENGKLWGEYNRGEINKQELREKRFARVLKPFDADKILDPFILEEYYLDSCPNKTSLMDGAIETLDYLEKEGYALHVVSNGFEETTHRKIESSGIGKYFENTITSEKLGATKPNRLFFSQALKISGSSPSETMMIGDNLTTDILGAIWSGLDQIYYNPKGISHREKPTHEISHLNEIRNIL